MPNTTDVTFFRAIEIEKGEEWVGGGWGGALLQPHQIFTKVDPILIDSDIEKKKIF